MGKIPFSERVRRQTQIGNKRVTYWSRGRKLTFYWYKIGHRLGVKIDPLPPRNREVEDLAAAVKKIWSCPLCHIVFERKGKQKFCTKAHAATHRKRRWLQRQRQAAELRALMKSRPDLRRQAEGARLWRGGKLLH